MGFGLCVKYGGVHLESVGIQGFVGRWQLLLGGDSSLGEIGCEFRILGFRCSLRGGLVV